MMAGYRSNPPKVINNSPVVKMNDYSTLVSTNCLTGETGKIELAKSDVIQFFLHDGSKISVRPSGTEPKIKFYFSVNAPLVSADRLEATEKMLEERISGIIADMKLA